MRNSSKGSSLDILSTYSIRKESGNIYRHGYKTFMCGLQIFTYSGKPFMEVFFNADTKKTVAGAEDGLIKEESI